MLGKLKNNVTRWNKDKLLNKYRKRLYIFCCVFVIFVALLPFTRILNIWLRLFPEASYIPSSHLIISVIDVGQGQSIAINFPNGEAMVIDVGVEESWDNVDAYLKNFVLKRSQQLNYLVITHADNDHTGNGVNVLNNYKIDRVYLPNMSREYEIGEIEEYQSYSSMVNVIKQKGVNVIYNIAGECLVVGDVRLTWIAPNRDYYQSSNDYSAVIKIEYLGYSMLIMGDAGHNQGLSNRVDVEAEVISYANSKNINLDVDVLVLGHHGSKYSTSIDLLKATSPDIGIISVGDNNYGHPAHEVFCNISKYDSENNSDLLNNIFTTKDYGNIVIEVDKTGEYSVQYIDNIHNYLFVSFVTVDVVILIPLLYYILDSLIIYKKIKSPKKIDTKL